MGDELEPARDDVYSGLRKKTTRSITRTSEAVVQCTASNGCQVSPSVPDADAAPMWGTEEAREAFSDGDARSRSRETPRQMVGIVSLRQSSASRMVQFQT